MMKKPLVKVLMPIFALLLSSCDFFSFFEEKFSTNTDSNNTNTQITIINNPNEETKPTTDYSGYPTSIEIRSSLPLEKGEEETISATISPTNSKYKTVTWESSDTSVATVKDGKITAVSPGKVEVTASTINNKGKTISSVCDVVVTDPNYITKRTLQYTYDDYYENIMFGTDNCPLEGSPKLLVVPVWFDDSDEFIDVENKETIRKDIEYAFFGTNLETGWRSVSSYYEEESAGKVTMDGVVTDWYETGTSYLTYAPKSGQDYTTSLVSSVADWYFSKPSSGQRSNFDSNKDGFLDGVVLVYAAPDNQCLEDSSKDNLWAYTYWTGSTSNVSFPLPNAFMWASYDFMYSPVDSLEKTNLTGYGNGDTRYCSVDTHTFIHEMGHVLGLQDYYDYSGQHSPAGGFSMQDMNVGGHDPYSVMAYGWAKPYVPSSTATIMINDFQSSHDLILLANHTVTSPFDEYLLLELYAPTGLNKFDTDHVYDNRYPSGSKEVGLRVWHVDARLTRWLGYNNFSTTLTTNPEAGNVYHAMSNTYYYDGVNTSGHGSYLGASYSEYNLLQLIHNKKNTERFGTDSIFGYSSTFSMTSHNSQFVGDKIMNDGNALGWEFRVEAIDSSRAAVTVTKA